MEKETEVGVNTYAEVITGKLEEVLKDPDLGVLLTPWLSWMLLPVLDDRILSHRQVDRLNSANEPYLQWRQNFSLTEDQKKFLEEGEQEVERIEKALEIYEGISRVLKGEY